MGKKGRIRTYAYWFCYCIGDHWPKNLLKNTTRTIL